MTTEQAIEVIQKLNNIEELLTMVIYCFVAFFIYMIFKGVFRILSSWF